MPSLVSDTAHPSVPGVVRSDSPTRKVGLGDPPPREIPGDVQMTMRRCDVADLAAREFDGTSSSTSCCTASILDAYAPASIKRSF